NSNAGGTPPLPRARADTTATFGRWQGDEPRRTQVNGQYTFKDANLNDIKGIAGILSSIGTYKGTLQRIEGQGQHKRTLVQRNVQRNARAHRGREADRNAELLDRHLGTSGATDHEVQSGRRRHQRGHVARARGCDA